MTENLSVFRQQVGGFNPGAGSFVPGVAAPAAEAADETWESAATVV